VKTINTESPHLTIKEKELIQENKCSLYSADAHGHISKSRLQHNPLQALDPSHNIKSK
jgi:hypothetical protein